MKLVVGILVLATLLLGGLLWKSRATNSWVVLGGMVVAVVAIVVVASIAGIWLRNRQRRKLLNMRDSALW